MLAAGAGLTGLITAASMTGQPVWLIILAGAVGSMLMMGITMLIGNFIYIYGVGVVPASGKAAVDPITGWNQEKYKTPGTEGHGIPTVCFVSGIIGGLLGGAGGGLVFWAINEFATVELEVLREISDEDVVKMIDLHGKIVQEIKNYNIQ